MIDFLLARNDRGSWWMKRKGGGRPRRVCTMADAGTLLRRSPRQVYRYIREGDIVSYGKPFGEHVLDHASVLRLSRTPMRRQPLPGRLRPLFPEYDVSKLNAGRDRELIMCRVLESGGMRDVRWLLKRYDPPEIKAFLAERGARILSPRAMRFWSLYFGVKPSFTSRPPSPWTDRNGRIHDDP